MIFAASPLASTNLGGVYLDAGDIVDPTSINPIRIELNGELVPVRVETINKSETQGQPSICSFTMTNPFVEPVTGDTVRFLYHESVEFAGTIEYVKKVSDDLQVYRYECECQDYGQILTRRQVRRNFTNMTVQAIVESVLDNELAGEGLTIGVIDSRVTVPLVDASKSSRVWDLFRDVANATGQIFTVGFDKTINMMSTTVQAAPLVLDEENVQVSSTEVKRDRESYRNRQVVVVTGTPPDSDTDPVTVTCEQENAEQIADRQEKEGGTGIYEEYEEITHPISNNQDDLTLLGNGYASMRLATAGTTRQTVTLPARGYGFRAGQIAQVDLPTFGIVGEFVIQRVSLGERGGQHLFHRLELVDSSAQRRAYESWLTVLSKGKIAIQLFGAIVHSSQLFTTPGAHIFEVPVGVTMVTITCKGGSGGGGGGHMTWEIRDGCQPRFGSNGGKGGNSGRATSTVEVVEGQELDIFVGSRGLAGNGGNSGCVATPTSTNGTAGTASIVFRDGISLAEAYGGGAGIKAPTGSPGANGGGSGAIVTVGGGKTGGAGGGFTYGDGGKPGGIGLHGDVLIEW